MEHLVNGYSDTLALVCEQRITNTYLNNICSFRMAAKDIRDGNYEDAAQRIRSDLDKVMGRDREILKAFVESKSFNDKVQKSKDEHWDEEELEIESQMNGPDNSI